MHRLARIAPALIGLALAAPATARAQSHDHAAADCPYCNASSSTIPVVQERSGPLARVMGGDRVVIPAGHHVQHPGQSQEGPVAAWTDTANALPPANAWYDGPGAEAGLASIGPGYGPGPVAPAPYGGYGMPAMGEPMPIGEMRTSYVPNAPAAAGPAGPMMYGPGAGPAAAPPMPDPAIQAWHQMGLGDDGAPARPGALSRMFGLTSVSNWLEGRRTMRAMRYASKNGMYSPSMNQMPGWAVKGR